LLQRILPAPGKLRIRWYPRRVEWRGSGFWLATLFQAEKELGMKFRSVIVASLFALTGGVTFASSRRSHS